MTTGTSYKTYITHVLKNISGLGGLSRLGLSLTVHTNTGHCMLHVYTCRYLRTPEINFQILVMNYGILFRFIKHPILFHAFGMGLP